jgi:hypothetical protein
MIVASSNDAATVSRASMSAPSVAGGGAPTKSKYKSVNRFGSQRFDSPPVTNSTEDNVAEVLRFGFTVQLYDISYRTNQSPNLDRLHFRSSP